MTKTEILQPRQLIKNPEISDLKEPLEIITGKIVSDGRERDYDLIIGDDTSGRIPTLVLSRVLNAIRHSEGLGAIPVRFVGGGRHRKELIGEELNDVLKRRDIQPGIVLLVTDHIASGTTMMIFGSTLGRRGIRYDIASIVTKGNETDYKNILNANTRLYIGREATYCPVIYHHAYLTGLNSGTTRDRRAQHIDHVVEKMGGLPGKEF